MPSDSMTFADLLRHTRTANGLTQEELAEQSGLSVRAISSLERGVNHAPRKDTLEMLADAFGLSAEERLLWERVRQRSRVPAGFRRGSTPPRVNLPFPLTDLIGRAEEVSEVSKLLATHRLTTLTGPGGIGKTRVAIDVGRRIAGELTDDVVLVDLAPVRDPIHVLPHVAAELGVRAAGAGSIGDALVTAVRARNLLLILDNLEQVIEAATDISRLLGACPSLIVLATSREPLRVSGEAAYPIRPLQAPEPDSSISVEQIMDIPSVALFVHRARLVQPDFELTQANAVDVMAICERLDGMPLAIELAAARLRSLSLQLVRERLEQPLDLLTRGARDLPDRQRTMRDTIQWSYDLLTSAEQALFRRLSVFVGGWSLDTVEAVGDHDGELGVEVVDGLSSLVEKSLVIQQTDAGGNTRYRLLEPIREFGLERLESANDVGSTRTVHAQAFLQVAKRSEPLLLSGSRDVWLGQLDVEYPNLRSAIRWLLRTDTAAALDLAGSLGWFWYLRGHFVEGSSTLKEALAADPSSAPSRARATALTSLARINFYQESFDEAAVHAQASVAMWQELGDQRALAHALVVAGLVTLVTGRQNRERALEQLQAAYQIFNDLDEQWGLAQALLYLGVANSGVVPGNPLVSDKARPYLEQSAALYRTLDDRWQLGIVLSYLALIADHDGDIDTARRLHEESHALAVESGDKWRIRLTGNRLGSLLHRCRDFTGAARMFTDVLDVSRDLGVEEFQAFEQAQLGRVFVDGNEADLAVPYLEDALRTYRDLGHQNDIAVVSHCLGDAHAQRHEPGAALSMYRDGLDAAVSIGATETIVNCLHGISRLVAREGGAELAVQLMSAADFHRMNECFEPPMSYTASAHSDRVELQAALGETGFEQAWNSGRAMHLDEVIAHVRRLIRDHPGLARAAPWTAISPR